MSTPDRSKRACEGLYERAGRRLLVYLIRRLHDVEAGTEIAATPMPLAPARRTSGLFGGRSRVLAGAGAGIAAFSAALVLIFAGATSPPAFAVTTNPDGTTTITLNALSAISALNAKLTATDVHVRVVPVVAGCDAPVQSAGSDAPPTTLLAQPQAGAADIQLSSTADPGPGAQGLTNVPAGQTLVLAASQSGLQAVGQIDQSSAPACVGLSSGQ
jgi:hypothetical protein